MVTAIPTEESTKRGRRSSSAQSSPPFQLADHEHFPPLPNGGGGSPSTCTTLALSQESSYLSDSESEDFPPAKKSRSGASSEEARITPCCSCSVHSTCTSLRTCACRSAGRACTACDPGSVGKCRCLTSTRSWAANALKSARERRAHEIAADAAARAAREKRTKQTSMDKFLGLSQDSTSSTENSPDSATGLDAASTEDSTSQPTDTSPPANSNAAAAPDCHPGATHAPSVSQREG